MPSRPTSLLDAAPITCANLAACICYFAYSVIASSTAHSLDGQTGGLLSVDGETLARLGGSIHEGLWDGAWQRLVLPMFLHGGLMHILMNMMSLWYLGPSAEVHFGPSNFGTIYFMSGIGGFCLSMLFGGHLSVGASGCIFGIEGAYLAVLIMQNARWTRSYRNPDVRRTFFIIMAYFLILSFAVGMDNWAHLGGLIFGTLYGMLFEYWRKHRHVGLALILVMLCLSVGLIVVTRWTFYDPWYYVHAGLRAEEQGRGDEAQTRFDQARECAGRWVTSEKAGMALIERAQNATSAGDAHAAARYLALAVAISPSEVSERARALLAAIAYLNQPDSSHEPASAPPPASKTDERDDSSPKSAAPAQPRDTKTP